VPLGWHIIDDLEELADSGLKLCTTIGNRQYVRSSHPQINSRKYWGPIFLFPVGPRVLEDVDDPFTQILSSRTEICEGGLFENLASAALNQDGAVLTSDLRCTLTAAEVSNKGPLLLYPLTKSRTKLFQVNKIGQ